MRSLAGAAVHVACAFANGSADSDRVEQARSRKRPPARPGGRSASTSTKIVALLKLFHILMTRLSIRVQPGARSDALLGWTADGRGGEVLKIRLRAPALEGKANAALIEFLAQCLGLRRSQIALLRGEKAREKIVAVEGMTMEEIKRRLQAAA